MFDIFNSEYFFPACYPKYQNMYSYFTVLCRVFVNFLEKKTTLFQAYKILIISDYMFRSLWNTIKFATGNIDVLILKVE